MSTSQQNAKGSLKVYHFPAKTARRPPGCTETVRKLGMRRGKPPSDDQPDGDPMAPFQRAERTAYIAGQVAF